jgi:VanZ family protein
LWKLKKYFWKNLLTLSNKTIPGSHLYLNAWRFLACSLALGVIYFSLNPSYPLKRTISNIPFGDSIIHIFSFGLLMYCICLSWKQKKIQLILGFILMVLAIALEIKQAIMGGIDFEIGDSIANTLGIWTGYLLASLRKKSSLTHL